MESQAFRADASPLASRHDRSGGRDRSGRSMDRLRGGRAPLTGDKPETDGIAHYLRLTVLGAALFVIGLGGWAVTAPLAGAVIASATVVVAGNDKKVQHQIGGIVAELRVKDGDHVKAGDLLIRLDETVARANLQIVAKQLVQGLVREARLQAERDGDPDFRTPDSLAGRLNDPEVAEALREEHKLFLSRRSAREGYKSQLSERVAQLTEEISGHAAQQTANERQNVFILDELKGVRDLYKQNLVQLTRLNALERESARLGGERGQLIASIAQTRGKIAEIQLQILQIDQDMRSDVSKDLRETQAKNAELVERKIAAEDQLRRVEIRSPHTGIVHQLSVHTIGGVIAAGEPIMVIVPQGESLVLEAKIAPQDIDHVVVGQNATVRLSAFNQRTTPEVPGKVSYVAADFTKEQQTNQAYYVARITLDEAGLDNFPNVRLRPGMPAEVHVQTGERTLLSYLLKPLRDQMARAFKEP